MTFAGEELLQRRTKIVATLGPACATDFTVSQLIRAGVNAFRINMAHGDDEQHLEFARLVRGAADDLQVTVALLADLAGPKVRVGRFPGGPVTLADHAEVTLTARAVDGNVGLIPVPDENIVAALQPGGRVLLADGLVELVVAGRSGDDVMARVVHGGIVSDGKGLHAPGAMASVAALTDRDRKDVAFLLDLGVDLIAISFVRGPDDVADVRALLPAVDGPLVVAKIERAEALPVIDGILEVSDAIMVARGDLGVDLPIEVVPIAQRQLIRAARAHSTPVIVATQMLESMTTQPRPTRAEVSDVSTAVFDSADAVMLSGETAAGRFPVAAVQVMDRVCREAEAYRWGEDRFASLSDAHDIGFGRVPMASALARSASQLSRDTRVRGIVVFTSDGATAQCMAAARPAAPIVVATTNAPVARQLQLLWGVVPMLVDDADARRPAVTARYLARDLELAEEGQVVLAVAGFGAGTPAITVVPV